MSVCMFVALQKTHFRVSWRPLVKEHIPNIGLWGKIEKRGPFSPRLLKRTILDQRTGDCAGVSSGRSVAVAVGY